jgi:hypothetical protein
MVLRNAAIAGSFVTCSGTSMPRMPRVQKLGWLSIGTRMCIQYRGGITLRVSHTAWFAIADAMERLGYMDVKKGFTDRRSNKGFKCRIRPRRKLAHRLPSAAPRIESHPAMDTIMLKNSVKRLIDYEETRATQQMRKQLTQINRQIASSIIALAGDSGAG